MSFSIMMRSASEPVEQWKRQIQHTYRNIRLVVVLSGACGRRFVELQAAAKHFF
jgi:hypothetical protein